MTASAFDALMSITPRPPVTFVRGQGSWLWDDQGHRYLDMVQGWAVNSLGHAPAVVAEALAQQARTLLGPGPGYYNAPALRLAGMLRESSGLERVFFANSGAEANEGAIKLARKWGALHRDGAYEIVTMENGFHGRTLATMSATGKPAWAGLFEPKVPGFPKAPLNDLAALERVLGERTVAVMLEPVQGEGGVIPAEPGYLRDLRRLTEERGLLLILDEVQTGIGRTGTLYAFEQAGIRPDLVTLGKGLGGGVPLAALLAREEVCCFAHGDQGGTFNGNALATAAGTAVVESVIAPGFLERVREQGAYLTSRLEGLSRRWGHGEVRGRGLLLALKLNRPCAPRLVATAFERGLLLNAPRPDVLRLMPALNVGREELDLLVEELDRLLSHFVGQAG